MLVDGRLVSPPYTLDVDGATFRLNAVPVAAFSRPPPEPKGPPPAPPTPRPVGQARTYQDIGAIIRSEWPRLRKTLPLDKAKKALRTRLLKEPLIVKLEDDSAGFMATYKLKDGRPALHHWSVWDAGMRIVPSAPVEPERMAASLLARAQACVKGHGLGFFVRGQLTLVVPGNSAESLLLRTNYVLMHGASRQTKFQALRALSWSDKRTSYLLCNFQPSQGLEDRIVCSQVLPVLVGHMKSRVRTLLERRRGHE